jgi:hypothetical protein
LKFAKKSPVDTMPSSRTKISSPGKEKSEKTPWAPKPKKSKNKWGLTYKAVPRKIRNK